MFIEQLEDLVIDIPQVVSFVAEFIASGILDDCLPFSFLKDSFQNLSEQQAEDLLADILSIIAELESEMRLREFFSQSGINILDLFRPENRNQNHLVKFLQEKKLELFPKLTYGNQLEHLITEESDTNKVLQWVQDNIPENAACDVELCRFVMQLVLKQVTSSKQPNEETKIKSYSEVLHYFLSDNMDLQFACLFDIQHFCNSLNFPKGLLERLFQSFSQCGVILPEVYFMWAEDTEDKSSGKEKALIQINKWLAALKKQS